MKNLKSGNIGIVVMTTAFLLLAGGLAFAADDPPMKPELAAKREMVRKQVDQRITLAKRKAAAEKLKAERMKVYQARQAAQLLKPVTTDNK